MHKIGRKDSRARQPKVNLMLGNKTRKTSHHREMISGTPIYKMARTDQDPIGNHLGCIGELEEAVLRLPRISMLQDSTDLRQVAKRIMQESNQIKTESKMDLYNKTVHSSTLKMNHKHRSVILSPIISYLLRREINQKTATKPKRIK